MYWYPCTAVLYWFQYSFQIRDECSWQYRISLSCTCHSFKPIAKLSTHSYCWLWIFTNILQNLNQSGSPPYDLGVTQMTSYLMKSNDFWNSMKQMMMLHPFCFAFLQSVSELRSGALFSNPDCSSERCISICDFSLSNSNIINTVPALFSTAIVSNCCIQIDLVSLVLSWWQTLPIHLVLFLPSIFECIRHVTLLSHE